MARAAINRLISSAARHQRTLRDHGYGWCISHQQTEQTRAADWMTQGSDQGLGASEERRSRTPAQRPRLIVAQE